MGKRASCPGPQADGEGTAGSYGCLYSTPTPFRPPSHSYSCLHLPYLQTISKGSIRFIWSSNLYRESCFSWYLSKHHICSPPVHAVLSHSLPTFHGVRTRGLHSALSELKNSQNKILYWFLSAISFSQIFGGGVFSAVKHSQSQIMPPHCDYPWNQDRYS